LKAPQRGFQDLLLASESNYSICLQIDISGHETENDNEDEPLKREGVEDIVCDD